MNRFVVPWTVKCQSMVHASWPFTCFVVLYESDTNIGLHYLSFGWVRVQGLNPQGERDICDFFITATWVPIDDCTLLKSFRVSFTICDSPQDCESIPTSCHILNLESWFAEIPAMMRKFGDENDVRVASHENRMVSRHSNLFEGSLSSAKINITIFRW